MPTIWWPWTRDSSPPVQKKKYETLQTPLLAITAFALGSVTIVTATLTYARYGRRLRNGDWITPDIFAKNRWIKGVVTNVGDADNFRLYHTPSLGFHWPMKFRHIPSEAKGLKDETLHIRIAGVDAPEVCQLSHAGLSNTFVNARVPILVDQLSRTLQRALPGCAKKILGKTVYCQLFRRDQYSRVVAIVVIPPRIPLRFLMSGKNLSLEMLRAGWATTYEQAGAEYGEWGKDVFLRLEAEAKAARRGMWKHGVDAETPAQYKRRHANAGSLEEAETARPKTKQRRRTSGYWKFPRVLPIRPTQSCPLDVTQPKAKQ